MTTLSIDTLSFSADDMGAGDLAERQSLSAHCQAVARAVVARLGLGGVTITSRPHSSSDDERAIGNAIFDAACGTEDVDAAADEVARRYA